MARLIVEAVSDEKHNLQAIGLRLCVSVSHADTGKPVTGLTKTNFRITNIHLGEPTPDHSATLDWQITVFEKTWDPGDKTPSGIYDMNVNYPFSNDAVLHVFGAGETYAFGVQVRTFGPHRPQEPGQTGITHFSEAVDFGQTVVSLVSTELDEP